jgi:two-component system nitrogen regulation sensor histidine kinase NtrY
VLEDHGGRIELKDASDFRSGQRGAWMRLRFAVTGHADKVEASDSRQAEIKQPVAETGKAAEATHNETKIEAAGN